MPVGASAIAIITVARIAIARIAIARFAIAIIAIANIAIANIAIAIIAIAIKINHLPDNACCDARILVPPNPNVDGDGAVRPMAIFVFGTVHLAPLVHEH